MSAIHANPFDSVNIFLDTKCKRALGMHWGTVSYNPSKSGQGSPDHHHHGSLCSAASFMGDFQPSMLSVADSPLQWVLTGEPVLEASAGSLHPSSIWSNYPTLSHQGSLKKRFGGRIFQKKGSLTCAILGRAWKSPQLINIRRALFGFWCLRSLYTTTGWQGCEVLFFVDISEGGVIPTARAGV